MTDKEFDTLWRLAFGTRPVHLKEAASFKKAIGMNDGNYLTNREPRYYRTGEQNEFFRIRD